MVAVILHGAVIAPSKADGTTWDVDLTNADPSAARRLVSLALQQASPYAFVLDVFQQPCAVALARPDAYGTAELETGFGPVPRTLPVIKDTFTPAWDVRWDGIPLTAATRLRATLWDKDLANDDPIGTFVIDGASLSAALASGTNYQIRVDGQTQAQVLFVGVEVVPEGSPAIVSRAP